MVRVAVAGGTGNVGRTLVDAIVDTGKHDVFVISRKVSYATPRAKFCYSVPSLVSRSLCAEN